MSSTRGSRLFGPDLPTTDELGKARLLRFVPIRSSIETIPIGIVISRCEGVTEVLFVLQICFATQHMIMDSGILQQYMQGGYRSAEVPTCMALDQNRIETCILSSSSMLFPDLSLFSTEKLFAVPRFLVSRPHLSLLVHSVSRIAQQSHDWIHDSHHCV